MNGERQGSRCLQNVAIVLRGYLASAAVLGVVLGIGLVALAWMVGWL